MKIAQVPVEVGIVGNFEGGKALPAKTGWARLCCLLVERVGIECTPLGRPTAMVPAESYKSASWTLVCYYRVHYSDQIAPGEMEPLASES